MAESHENVIWKSEFTLIFFSDYIPIATHLLCQVQVNSSGDEFLLTIFKFMRMIFVIACLHADTQNVKLGIFPGSRAVDSKEMYKKA